MRQPLQPADADRVGAQRHGLDDVGAAQDAAVDDDLGAPLHRLDDLGQHGHAALAVVELPSAVVGHVDALDAVLEGDQRVLGRGDALQDEGKRILLAQPRERRPRRSAPGSSPPARCGARWSCSAWRDRARAGRTSRDRR